MADGFEQACKVAVDHLAEISTTINFTEDNIEPLVEVALTTLSSKIVNKFFSLLPFILDSNARWPKSP